MLKILNQNSYQEYLSEFSDYHFIQSAEHNYQDIMYGNCSYVGFFENEKPVILFKYATTNIMKGSKVALGSFGPIINTEKVTEEIFHKFFQELQNTLREQNIIFLQIYPVLLNEKNSIISSLLKSEGLLHKAPKKFTWLDGTMIVELDKDLDELFQNFRKDVKYNIKKAAKDERLSIAVYEEPTEAQIESFLKLYEKQQSRKDFKDRAIDFYTNLLTSGKAILFESKYEGELVSAIVGVKFESQNTLITYISASVQEAFKSRAPTLLRWELIKWAKENGYKRVDFFSLDKNTPSVSNFKRGFRPTEILFPEHAYDLIVKPELYYPYQVYAVGRRIIGNG